MRTAKLIVVMAMIVLVALSPPASATAGRATTVAPSTIGAVMVVGPATDAEKDKDKTAHRDMLLVEKNTGPPSNDVKVATAVEDQLQDVYSGVTKPPDVVTRTEIMTVGALELSGPPQAACV